jgi:Flp pilus assembly protein TadG
MAWLAASRGHLARFLSNERGAAGLEFLFTSPLLFGILVFTAEYGQALRYRIALDGAVQDTARFLARAPAEAIENGAGDTIIEIYPAFRAEADAMLDDRLGRDVAMLVETATLDTESFRTPFYMVEVTASVDLDLPMLAFVNLGLTEDIPESLTLTASQQARWGGGNVPGHEGCPRLARIQQAC